MKRLAAQLKTAGDEYPTVEQRQQAAQWIGRTLGYLEGAAQRRPTAEQLQTLRADLAKILPVELHPHVAQGRQAALKYAGQLAAIAAKPPEELKQELAQRRSQVEADLQQCETERTDLADQVTTAKRQADEQEQRIRNATVGIRNANQQVEGLAERARQLQRSSYGRTEEVKERVPKFKEVERDGKKYKVPDGFEIKTKTVRRPETPDETARRLGDIQRHLDQIALLNTQIETTKAALPDANKAMREEREEALRTSRRLSPKIRQAMERRRSLQQQLDLADGWLMEPAKFKDHIQRVDPYVPWDVELLRDHLWDSFSAKANGPSSGRAM